MQPTLDAIRAAGGQATNQQICAAVAATLELAPSELEVKHKDKNVTELEYRLMWARTYLRKAGYIDQVERGTWALTDLGQLTAIITPSRVNKMARQAPSREKSRRVPAPKYSLANATEWSGSRNALMRNILRDADQPLHYTEIHRRALVQLPQEHYFTERIAYASLYASASFRLHGDGVFGLEEWESKEDDFVQSSNTSRTVDGELRFVICPQPLLPKNAHPRAFFDSIMMIKQLIYDAPHLTARQIYLRAREWAGLGVVQLDGAQEAFNAWYCAGMCDYIDFANQAQQPLRLTLPETNDVSILRDACLHALLQRIDCMRDVTTALISLPSPTVSALRTVLSTRIGTSQELTRCLNLLMAFEAVRREGDTWRITQTGEVVAAEFPAGEIAPYNTTTSSQRGSSKIATQNVLFEELLDYELESHLDGALDSTLPHNEYRLQELPLGDVALSVDVKSYDNTAHHEAQVPPDVLLVAETQPTLPKNQTPDLSIESLIATFDDVSNAYKFLWLLALLKELDRDTYRPLPLDVLLSRMVAIAWSLEMSTSTPKGKADALTRSLVSLREPRRLPDGITGDTLTSYLLGECQLGTDLGKEVRRLGDYVPYRFLRPFLREKLNGIPDGQLHKAILIHADEEYHRASSPCLYRFVKESRLAIDVHPAWRVYLCRHAPILRGYALWGLRNFLQRSGRPDTLSDSESEVDATLKSSVSLAVPSVVPPGRENPSAPDSAEPIPTLPRWTYNAVRKQMYAALAEATRILFPLRTSSDAPIINHTWSNPTYIGLSEDHPVAWRGWSINLSRADAGYGVLYIDFVENRLTIEQRRMLFGQDFLEKTRSMREFVVAFVAGIAPEHTSTIGQAGYTVRIMGKTIHACMVASPEDFLNASVHAWAGEIVRLAKLKLALTGQMSVVEATRLSGELILP